MIRCTIVGGGTALAREATIAALIDTQPTERTAVIIEGGIEPGSRLAQLPDTGTLAIRIIAAGCPCCNNGLVMRVTLDRILQKRPALLYIALADEAHTRHLQQFLGESPYSSWVVLAPPVSCCGQDDARTF